MRWLAAGGEQALERRTETWHRAPAGCMARVGCRGTEPDGAVWLFMGLGQNGSMDLHLNGKVVLITGGTDGLGAALAGRLI